AGVDRPPVHTAPVAKPPGFTAPLRFRSRTAGPARRCRTRANPAYARENGVHAVEATGVLGLVDRRGVVPRVDRPDCSPPSGPRGTCAFRGHQWYRLGSPG